MSWAEPASLLPLREMSSSIYLLPTILFIPITLLVLRWVSTPKLPTVNSYPGDFSQRKARETFVSNAKSLLAEGFRRFNGPFRVVTTLSSRVILPASWATWVKNCQDLDHSALVCDEYFAEYPGMDGQAALQDPRRFPFEVIKTKLNQNSQCQIMQDYTARALEDIWTNQQDWHSIDFNQDVIRIIGRVTAVIFVGPELASDPEWQNIIVTYTTHYFNSVRVLREWPRFIRPFVHWFLPECKVAREQVRLARRLMAPVLEQRRAAKEAAEAENRRCEFNDAIEWIDEAARGLSFDAASVQLGFAIGALHTTTELLKQAILDICMHPELVQPIREEAQQAIQEGGWTTAGVFKMQLLDSVVKETQRLKPGSLVGLERKAMKDIILPNGITLRRGTKVAVDCSMMRDATNYPDPDHYDGYRFLKLRQSGESTAGLASTSAQHVAFGMGKAICPGRFFAANEIKIILAKILQRYDIRLVDGFTPNIAYFGFEMLSDPEAKVEVRKRLGH
ncbi:cytochrome P450 [Aspergillus bertholletiae]|uniref:Cytochrome P450 n=1 Tax=Aspergillus bertholletiae TaxID=1226010 RepID=A0A5N7B4E3_9EURO|nr:cytochrome P450 [Aspergillus bertholletiae]